MLARDLISINGFAISPIDVAMLGTEVVAASFCMEGLIEAVLLLARRSREGIRLMFAAIGAAITLTAQPVTVNAARIIRVPERFV